MSLMAEVRRSRMIMNSVNLTGEGAITLVDLTEFGEELQERVRFFIEREP